jgi:TIR domain-containing protein
MRDLFISHVAVDRETAEDLAFQLDAAGFTTWYFERDSLPGSNYLLQTRSAIDGAQGFILIISAAAIERGLQIDKEIARAYEKGRKIIPILKGVTFASFQEARPGWHQALGTTVGVELLGESTDTIMPRILAGLKALHIVPTKGDKADNESAAAARHAEPSVVVEGMASGHLDDESAVTVLDDDDVIEDELLADCLCATFVHEHQTTGFLADLIVTKEDAGASVSIRVAFTHELLGAAPCCVEIQLPPTSDPVQYLRLPKLMQGFPVVLRIYWLTRLPEGSTLSSSVGLSTDGLNTVPTVCTRMETDTIVSDDSAGIVSKGRFKSIIPADVQLPCVEKRRFRTSKSNQKALSFVPAVRHSDGTVRQFPKLRLSVPPAPAGTAWMQFTFRVDPDGRFTIDARDPLREMRVREIAIVH